MKKKITKHLHGFHKKLKKQSYTLFAVFILLFASVSFFFITRGAIPHSSELAYIEHSILGKDAGSVVPASCNSVPPTSHFLNDCTTTCWNGTVYDPYLSPGSCPPPRNCISLAGITYPHGGSATAYQYSTVNTPATCASVSETRLCWDGTISGSYLYNSCVVKSGTITVPASCVIAAEASTCDVIASWVSANLNVGRFYDNNTNTTLASGVGTTTPWNGSQTVWVAYGGTTFKLTDSTLHEYDSKIVVPTLAPGTTWNVTTNQAEHDATATLTANPTKVSYNHDSNLTWGSNHATACTAGGAWSNAGTLSGSGSTGNLTLDQIYTFQCTGLGAPSPVATANVTVCLSNNPVLNKDDVTCQPAPTFTAELTGQYTPNGEIVVDPLNVDSCSIKRNGVTIESGSGSITANFSTAGTYSVECSYTDGNGDVITSTDTFVINYSPVPPPPIVSLKASPTTISAGSPSVLTWTVTYPNSVQVPSRPACTLTARPVCPSGSCDASQLAASSTINAVIQTENTDTNDSDTSRRITSTALNVVTDSLANIASGDTDWKTNGKKTFILDKSMDFKLDCGNGVNESQSVRVLVTVPVEG